MATYAIGDIQGCYREFDALLGRLGFDPSRDTLWLVGDLINRGPDSLQVVRRVRELGDSAVTVLGNHELHLLAIHYNGAAPKSGDTFDELMAAPEFEDICQWMRTMPLLVADSMLGFVMTHAGIPHVWDLEQARACAREVEEVIQGDRYREYFAGMYGNEPDCWDEGLRGVERWRVITNYFTRMRLVDQNGRLNLTHKGTLDDAPPGWYPWYELRARRPLGATVVFGHWAALRGMACGPEAVGLDTGCVWGGGLTALCLDTGEFTSIPTS